MSLASDRDERRRLMAAANEKLEKDPEAKKRLAIQIQKASRYALNGSAPPEPKPEESPCPKPTS